ncbi:MAG: GHKL domain-containing protein, partial [Deltaproteobacteria bacterium]|nr:GHKL domain-containing protein [Deltaproteobacteria bacterium]
DITKWRQAAEELRIERDNLRRFFEAMEDGIYIINQYFDIQYVNPVLVNEFGPYEGLKCYAYLEDREDVCPRCKSPEVFAGKTMRCEWFFAKNGRTYDQISTPLENPDGSILKLSIFRDITERVKAEAKKRELEAYLRQQQKLESIGTLASGVAHEINNPITGIMNYAQLIHDRLDPGEGRLREFSAGIIEETERVAEIVRNLLAFSRQDEQAHSPARMADIVDKTLSLIRAVIRRDQITLEVDLPDDLPTIKCRSQQIQQVLMNLLTNARDALNEHYPEYDPDKVISVTVHPFEKDGRPWLRTTVEDHGVGIPEEIRERIFDPFYTTKDRTQGTGLGLSISLGIVQDHHGELTFESEENQFTRFYLDLPVDNGWET